MKNLPAVPQEIAFPYNEAEMIADLTPEKAHADSVVVLLKTEVLG